MQTNQIEAVAQAARILGNQAKMARALDVTPVTVGQWLKLPEQGGREVPPKQCVRIERLTHGAVKRQALRADDWEDFWPELALRQEPRAQDATETVANAAAFGPERRHTNTPQNPDLERRVPLAVVLAGGGV